MADSTVTEPPSAMSAPYSSGRWERLDAWRLAREHSSFYGVIVLSTIALLALDWSHRAPDVAQPLTDLPSALLALLLGLDLAILRLTVYRVRYSRSWRESWNDLRRGPLRSERLASLVLVAFGIRWLMLTAVSWKTVIPALHSFCCDTALLQADTRLLGKPAWEYFGWFYRSPVVVRLADRFYYVWFIVFAWVVLAVAWRPYSAHRRRFLLAMALLWTIGSLAGVAWSSAGPVYYARVTGHPISYDAIARRLDGYHLLATQVQQQLWASLVSNRHVLIAGIAAFPSLHVAVPALLTVSARTTRWRVAGWLLTVATWFCSVALGWHYLVDGAGGIAIAMFCWQAGGFARSCAGAFPASRPSDQPHTPLLPL